MTAAAFDTCAAAERLRDAGFDERQAEAAVTVVHEAVGAEQDPPATKVDLDAAIAGLETRLRIDLATTTDLQALEGRMRAELGTIRTTIGLRPARRRLLRHRPSRVRAPLMLAKAPRLARTSFHRAPRTWVPRAW